MILRTALTIAALLLAGPAAGEGGSSGCGIYPEGIQARTLYTGWSDCTLKRVGEAPLWHGIAPDLKQVMRFTFADGHAMFTRVVRIEERADGTGRMTVLGTMRRTSVHQPIRMMHSRRIKLDTARMARINQLTEATGTFAFEEGSWDGQEIYMHCQVLDMERANAAGYRISTVNIGCNHPAKLMPLIDEIVLLANLKSLDGGRLYY